MIKECSFDDGLFVNGRMLRAAIPRASYFSLGQPLLEPGTLLLRSVPLAIPADGHVLTARYEAAKAVGIRCFFGLRAFRLLDAYAF